MREHSELEAIARAVHNIERITVATQAEVNELVTTVGSIEQLLEEAKKNIEQEFSVLEGQLGGSGVDLTPLKTAIDALTPTAQALEALKAAPPAAEGAAAAAAPAAGAAAAAPTNAQVDQAAASA